MGFGLFGKLPQKRDFISFGIAQDILTPLETWLQSALAASRAELGKSWEQHYLVAPLWRFWIGPAILGTGCAGVIMPSVDGVGRYFPLMALYACGNSETIAPPPFAPQGDWFSALEGRLLSVLHNDGGVEIDVLLAGLPAPALEQNSGSARENFKGGTLWRGGPDTGTAALLTGIVEEDYRLAARTRTYWWTNGSADGGPVLLTKDGLPDPYFYTLMLKSVAD
jgi:type VI secretion system protein ImpM